MVDNPKWTVAGTFLASSQSFPGPALIPRCRYVRGATQDFNRYNFLVRASMQTLNSKPPPRVVQITVDDG